ncbi:beta-ketoacyl-ACP synthase II [Thermodesulfobacteriota bacterium]
MEKRRVVITGLGVVAPNGIGLSEFWKANKSGISGIENLSFFDTTNFQTKIAGEVKNLDPEDYMPKKTAKSVDRFVHLGLSSTKMAIDDSGLDLEKEDKERIGVIIGSGLGGALFHEEQMILCLKRGAHRANPAGVPRTTPNAVAAHIAIQYGLLGPNLVISTACASGNHAIGEAFKKIQYNEADIIITGGAEAPLTEFTFGAFYAMRVLSRANGDPSEVSKPFDNERDGFVMGEGAGILVLEELGRARKRNAHIYGEIVGYGMTSGAYHIALPQPDGKDAARAMALALSEADVKPQEIDYINAHGTATRANDMIETKAIKEVFGAQAYKLMISSTKSMTGHAIGAAGAIEAVVCCLALENQTVPPTINYKNPDPDCDLDYVPNHARKAELNHIISNSFGFGSVNATLLIKRVD